uniref:Glycosyl transferase n=1 Tax=uncultured marine thaumarchaeote KM3_89_C12 TaxID=1456339 RepID=A0A075I088_9ARCH|nr:glycosyl transferase [uncultured marine thaumarchaeote KM3_89_C12]
MKIALVCPASLPATQFGGILFLAVDIAREATNLGNNVVIYTTDLDFANNAKTFNKDLPKEETLENFTIKRSHVWFRINLFFVNPGIYFQMMKDSPDVIHTIGIRSFQSFIAAIIAKKKKIPLVISDQGGLTTHPDLNSGGVFKKILYKLQTPMIRFIINNSARISVANEYEKEIFTKMHHTSKIEVIRNGINLAMLKTKTNDFKKKYGISLPFVLFIGRFSKIKGIDVLLRAIKILKDKPGLKNISFVIMGVDFGFQNQMMQMIDDFGIKEKIHVITNPSRDDVIAAYGESEFLVLPSRWELSPLTPLEGFAFKKPVVSTNVHGIPSTVTNRQNGILVKNEDFHELAEAIMELINDKQKCLEYGLSGYNLVQTECNSKSMVDKTLRMYNQIINR